MGVWINVQKFGAPSDLRFYDTDHGEHLYFPAFVRVRSADPGADLQRTTGADETPVPRCA
jgi:hypothetical protein